MQIFEAFELKELPYMETKEIVKGEKVSDIINDESLDKVYLLVDHDLKRIWTYNGSKSSFKLQIYGGILASELRKQLKLFYRVFPLNEYAKDSKTYKEVMDRKLGGGRAKSITKDDISGPPAMDNIARDLTVHPSLNANKAIELLDEIPKPENYLRRLMIIGNTIYSDEEFTEAFLKEEKIVTKVSKMGPVNRGFTFFGDANYSTRLIVKDRKVQGVELYVAQDDISPPLILAVPIIQEEKISRSGEIENIIEAFQIPDELPEEEES
jgi:hypothetical protein